MSTVAVEVERTVDAPVDRVWAVFADLAARPRWLSTVESVEPLSTGEFGVGTAWRETRVVADEARVVEELRVVACEPRHWVTLASPGIGADYRMTYTFTALARSRTEVRIVLEGTPQGAASRVLAILLGGLAARTVEGALRRDLDDLAAAARAADQTTAP
ncbi:MAG TPA: SRPBCC family protein [Micromonosporaceae bacterium]|jgi:uncharacterized membrane protein|nr:SRPBCC family protein [Micromonosporaceae bacterium]